MSVERDLDRGGRGRPAEGRRRDVPEAEQGLGVGDFGPVADVREVRRVHGQWWEANQGLDVERMRECFAPGYLMWNLNGHPYYGLNEKIALFQYYKGRLVPAEPPRLWDVRVVVVGDMAYVTSEGVLPFEVSGDGSGSATLDAVVPLYDGDGRTVHVRFRETCVLRRDDGEGGRAWKIWHFHCSPLAPEHEPRPGFGDTAAGRRPAGVLTAGGHPAKNERIEVRPLTSNPEKG
ncbi:YybH family protein [Actinomadura sp. 3N508]|uniref:YybH family protein n=1 Tax=Actinomadura sp. 3N508 TaxID=3375153 RepID=UPI0037AFBEE4